MAHNTHAGEVRGAMPHNTRGMHPHEYHDP